MSRIRVFQSLVIAGVLLDGLLRFYSHIPLVISQYLLWLPMDLVLSEEKRVMEVLSGNGLGSFLPFHPAIGMAFLVAFLLAAVGLLFFQNWGRHLFLALVVVGMIWDGLAGLGVSTPFENAFSRLQSLLDGAVLALAYLSPVRDCFASRAPSNSTADPDARKSCARRSP